MAPWTIPWGQPWGMPIDGYWFFVVVVLVIFNALLFGGAAWMAAKYLPLEVSNTERI